MFPAELKCTQCLDLLERATPTRELGDHSYNQSVPETMLLSVKNRGGLVQPSEAVSKILHSAERYGTVTKRTVCASVNVNQ